MSNFNTMQAQCGSATDCNSNTGIFSNNNATDIAYDNMGSSFHSTYIKEPNNVWKVWGEHMANSGSSDVLSPINFDATNYPILTGTIYKMALGSSSIDYVELIVLTSDGLFVLGDQGAVLDTSLTTSSTFQKITVNGKADGLPLGVSAIDVKMMFASAGILMITTCNGSVYTLSRFDDMRGDGGVGNSTQWSRVMQNPTTPLTNVIVARGASQTGFALKSDGTLWTWGTNTYLGNGTASANRNYATLMTLPVGMPAIKMIQATPDNSSFDFMVSYYILGVDKKVYSLGNNQYGQLGDRTSIERKSWVNAKNPDNTIITDAGWISSNEHDDQYPGIALLKTNGILYTAGINSTYMIGRNINIGINYLDVPTGISSSDIITFAETGGHTCALIKQCYPKYGYVGHLIDGSMGNGTSNSNIIQSYDFTTPPSITVCGAQYVQPIISCNGAICPGQDAIFYISGSVGDTLSYIINGGSTQTVVIGASGTAQVVVTNATTAQTINFTHILGANSTCSYDISITQTVTMNGVALFTPVPPICQGQTISALPTLSNNGIEGTWSPALNNQQTTQYTFTPTTGTCGQATMTIVVNPASTIPVFSLVNPICEGEIINPLPTISNNSISGAWLPTLNNSQTTIYAFTPDNTGGACALPAQLTVVVNPKVIPIFNQVPPICEGSSLSDLPINSNNSIVGSWLPSINNTSTTTYTFTPNFGTCASTASMTIVVNPKVTPNFNQVTPICEGSNLSNLPTISSDGISGSWTPSMNNTSTTTYTFTPNSGSCANAVPMTIVVNPKIIPTFPQFVGICYGDTQFTLPSLSNNGVLGTWTPVLNNIQTTTYTFNPNDGECALPNTLQLPVFSNFDFMIDSYCQNKKLMLQILSNGSDVNTSNINWICNNVTVNSGPTFDVTSFLNSTASPGILPLTFSVTMTNSNICSKTKSITIDSIYCDIPNIITDNNDTFNDTFDLKLLNVKQIYIYNRWGRLVYDKENYIDEWYGQTNEGKILPDGVYFYILEFFSENSKTGWVFVKN